MAVTLDTLKEYTLEKLKKEISVLRDCDAVVLRQALTLFQHPRFEELGKVWRIAGETPQDYKNFRELADLIKNETHVSEIILGTMLNWYYVQSEQAETVPQPQS